MNHVLVLNTEFGERFIANDHKGNFAWFKGNPFRNDGTNNTFIRSATFEEFKHLERDTRYTSGATDLTLLFPSKWVIVSKLGNTLLIKRSIGTKVHLANLYLQHGKVPMHSVVKNIDTKEINGEKIDEVVRFFYDGKFNSTVVELLPGFKPIDKKIGSRKSVIQTHQKRVA